jgi:hypothetical protein
MFDGKVSEFLDVLVVSIGWPSASQEDFPLLYWRTFRFNNLEIKQ